MNEFSGLVLTGQARQAGSAEPQQRRAWMVGIVGLLAAPWLTGCSKPVPLCRVGSIVFPSYELMFLARDQHFFDEQALRLVTLQASADAMRALAAGQLEAAALTLDETMALRAAGVDMRVVMVFDVQAQGNAVRGRSGVRPADITPILGPAVNVLAVRADALEVHGPSIYTLVQAVFQARQFWLDKPAQAGPGMALRMGLTMQELPLAFRGLQLSDPATNRSMLQRNGSLHRTVQDLQKRMFDAGLLHVVVSPETFLTSDFLPG